MPSITLLPPLTSHAPFAGPLPSVTVTRQRCCSPTPAGASAHGIRPFPTCVPWTWIPPLSLVKSTSASKPIDRLSGRDKIISSLFTRTLALTGAQPVVQLHHVLNFKVPWTISQGYMSRKLEKPVHSGSERSGLDLANFILPPFQLVIINSTYVVLLIIHDSLRQPPRLIYF